MLAQSGIDNSITYEGETAAWRFANELLSNSFDICMGKTIEEIKSDLKQFASLGTNEGQVKTTPGNMQRIHVFIQWTCDMIRTGLEPPSLKFPVDNTALLIKNYKSP